RNGFSLRLEGLERGINHKALERTIVMHGAWYVSEAFAQEHGRLGRSWGCPALEKDVAPEVIETIKNGSLLFIYHPEQQWQAQSEFLNGCRQSSSSPDRAVSTSASRR
ncbi:MAG: murein L,D-transpeptidase catalytic domain-containing protein, partial [Thermoanaerobaculia bacterium]